MPAAVAIVVSFFLILPICVARVPHLLQNELRPSCRSKSRFPVGRRCRSLTITVLNGSIGGQSRSCASLGFHPDFTRYVIFFSSRSKSRLEMAHLVNVVILVDIPNDLIGGHMASLVATAVLHCQALPCGPRLWVLEPLEDFWFLKPKRSTDLEQGDLFCGGQ